MEIAGRGSVRRVPQAPRHSEVNQENPSTLEPKNQILAAAVERRDHLVLEPGCDLRRVERPGQTRVRDLDPLDPSADERRLEPGTNRLDLW